MLNQLALLAENSIWSLGANVTLSGIVIVFLGLVLLVVVIGIFSAFFGKKQKSNPAQPQQPVRISVPTQPAAAQAADDFDEIVAVIAAAVDAMYSGSGKKVRIHSVRRSAVGSSAWAMAGRMENTRAF